MTMPVLISNYQKRVLVNQLKAVYTELYNAIKMAEVDYGDTSSWQYFDENLSVKQNSWNFTNTYLAPYFKKVDLYQSDKLINCEDTVYRKPDGSVVSCTGVFGFCETCSSSDNSNMVQIHLPSGAIIIPLVRKTGTDINGFYTEQVEIDVDTNGYKGPNVLGRDIFRLQMGRLTGYKLLGTGNQNHTRTIMLSECEREHIYSCAGLIMSDGWEISSDYPW